MSDIIPQEAAIELTHSVASLLEAVKTLHERAANALPPGTVYQIRGLVPADYGRSPGVVWRSYAGMQHRPVTGEIPWPGKANPADGYLDLGTFRTPGVPA